MSSKNSRGFVLALAALMLAGTLLAGCGGTSAEDQQKSTDAVKQKIKKDE